MLTHIRGDKEKMMILVINEIWYSGVDTHRKLICSFSLGLW